MGDLLPQSLQLLFRVPVFRDVKGNAAHPRRLAFTVELDAAATGRPAHLPIWQRDRYSMSY